MSSQFLIHFYFYIVCLSINMLSQSHSRNAAISILNAHTFGSYGSSAILAAVFSSISQPMPSIRQSWIFASAKPERLATCQQDCVMRPHRVKVPLITPPTVANTIQCVPIIITVQQCLHSINCKRWRQHRVSCTLGYP